MDDGISFPDAYGKVLGSAAICAVLFIGLTLIPRHHVQVLFPPAVTGSILVLVGLDSLTRGYTSVFISACLFSCLQVFNTGEEEWTVSQALYPVCPMETSVSPTAVQSTLVSRRAFD